MQGMRWRATMSSNIKTDALTALFRTKIAARGLSPVVRRALVAAHACACGAAVEVAAALDAVADYTAAAVLADCAIFWMAHSKLSKVWLSPAATTSNVMS